jgi:hypothetical protein
MKCPAMKLYLKNKHNRAIKRIFKAYL